MMQVFEVWALRAIGVLMGAVEIVDASLRSIRETWTFEVFALLMILGAIAIAVGVIEAAAGAIVVPMWLLLVVGTRRT